MAYALDERVTTQTLRRDVGQDIADRKSFVDRIRAGERKRLTRDKRKVAPYPGAPDLAEPLIDDNVRRITSAEMSILWSTRTLAVFIPLTSAGAEKKRLAEAAFDTLLRRTLNVRAKLENLFDAKNERGITLAKLTVNDTAVPGRILPDFEPVDALDVVVPSVTKRIQDADRVTCISRYTPREFAETARKKEWRGHERVLKHLAAGDGASGDTATTNENAGDPSGLYGSTRAKQLGEEQQASDPTIAVWECYHYRRDNEAGKYRKWVSVFCPELPEVELRRYPWRWPDTIIDAGEIAPDGTVIREMTIKPGDDRAWPFVAFRWENRSLYYHDVRGVSDLLKTDQQEASAYRNAKALFVDYTCKPFTKGGNKPIGFRWRPGDHLPEGFEFVTPPPVDPIFDYSTDMARAAAALRVGSPQGAMSSRDKSRDTKTATEVSQEALNANMLSTDAVERFTEPLGELFTMMWEYLRHHPVTLPALVTDRETVEVTPDVFDSDFLVVAGVSGKSANPDLMLRQLGVIGEMLQAFPQAAQFLRGAEVAQLLVDLLDPKLTPRLVVDPENAGAAGAAPVEQQVAQLAQAIFGSDQMPGLAQQVQSQGQYLSTIAAEDAQETPAEKAPAQPGRPSE